MKKLAIMIALILTAQLAIADTQPAAAPTKESAQKPSGFDAGWDKTKAKSKQYYDITKQKTKQYYDDAKKKTEQTWPKVKKGSEKAYDTTKDKTESWYDKMKDKFDGKKAKPDSAK